MAVFACSAVVLCGAGAISDLPPEPSGDVAQPSEPDVATSLSRSTAIPAGSTSSDPGWPALFGPAGNGHARGAATLLNWGQDAPRELWRISLGTGYSAPVASGDRVVLFHRQADDEVLSAVELESGREIWRKSHPTRFRCKYEYSSGPYSTPRIDGDFVYAVGAEARLVCRHLRDGMLAWERDLRTEFHLSPGPFGFGAQILVYGPHVILNVGGRGAGIVALSRATGEVAWKATDHGAAYTMPQVVTVGPRAFVVALTDVGLVSLDAARGQVCDEVPFRSPVVDSVTAVTPLVRGRRVLAVAGRGPGAACFELDDEGRLNEVWRAARALDSLFNTLVWDGDDGIFGFTSARQGGAQLRKLDWTTGRVVWSHASELERGQGLVIGGSLVVLGEQGHLAAFDRKSSVPVASSFTTEPVLTGPCFSAPAYHRGALVARSESVAACWRIAE